VARIQQKARKEGKNDREKDRQKDENVGSTENKEE